MTGRLLTLILAVLILSAGLSAADDPLIGTWTMNAAKSKYDTGTAPQNQKLQYLSVPQGIHHITDGADTKGKPTHNEWTAKFDGKDYPYQSSGGSTVQTVALKRVNASSIQVIRKQDGKVTSTFILKVSPDGKLLTRTSKDASGKMSATVAVYDRQ
jgi:hypothetical protein